MDSLYTVTQAPFTGDHTSSPQSQGDSSCQQGEHRGAQAERRLRKTGRKGGQKANSYHATGFKLTARNACNPRFQRLLWLCKLVFEYSFRVIFPRPELHPHRKFGEMKGEVFNSYATKNTSTEAPYNSPNMFIPKPANTLIFKVPRLPEAFWQKDSPRSPKAVERMVKKQQKHPNTPEV